MKISPPFLNKIQLQFYVYAHVNPVTNKFFYIGKGTDNRAESLAGRSKFWHSAVAKYGLAVVKIADGLTEQESFEIEKQYIAKYGLRIEGGTLVNMAYGGAGGRTIFEHNVESVRKKCRAGKIGDKNPNYGKKTWLSGLSMPQETKDKLRISRTGYRMPQDVKEKVLAGLKKAADQSLINRTHKVQCLITGQVWDNRNKCADDLNITMHTYRQRIFRNVPIKGNHLQLIKK